LLALAACGGGGGSGGGSSTGAAAPASGASTPSTTSSATSANVSTPQYAASSAQLAAFTLLNTERQQCGFPALAENTQLDTAASNHAQYMGLNGGTITDTEVSGNAGFTGVSYADRAAHVGYPTNVSVGGVSAGYYTNATLTNTQYGQNLVYAWLSGVYHIGVAAWPVTSVGVGVNQTTFNGFPEIQGTLTLANPQAMTSSGPLTFPCQGTTGIAYKGGCVRQPDRYHRSYVRHDDPHVRSCHNPERAEFGQRPEQGYPRIRRSSVSDLTTIAEYDVCGFH
jgi:hypothetical protein